MRGVLLFVTLLALSSAHPKKDLATEFRDGVKNFFGNDKRFSSDFKRFLSTIDLKHAFRTGAESWIDSSIICEACDGIIDAVIDEIHAGTPIEDIANLAIGLCVDLDIEPEPVCTGAVNLNVGILYYIIQARPELRADRICGIVAQSYECAGSSVGNWSIDIPAGITEIEKGVISELPSLRIVHVSDFHYDPLYEAGALASCPAPACCQPDSGDVVDPEDGAGFWGDYRNCDTPWWAIEDAVQHIAEEHPDLDVVYYTGDTISHRVWDTSKQGNINDMTLLYNTLVETFEDTLVLPILGNHEPHPLNVWAPVDVDEELQTQWVFDLNADLWGPILGEGTAETIRKGGYYTVLVRPGYRVIALNSNVGYTFNFWLLYDDVDPFGQLQWLADTLYEAEQNGEIVHILSHVPSSSGSCYSIWSREYRRIVDRFAGTIAAAFNGHSHDDEFILYHDREEPQLPTTIAFNGASVTTFSHKNPNYKLYHVDAESFEVLDVDVWSYNITEANLTPEQRPRWFKLYSFKEAYGMNGLAPEDLRDLAFRMVDDRSLSFQYWQFRHRMADTALANGCNDNCQRNLVCEFLRSEFQDNTQCDEITAEW